MQGRVSGLARYWEGTKSMYVMSARLKNEKMA